MANLNSFIEDTRVWLPRRVLKFFRQDIQDYEERFIHGIDLPAVKIDIYLYLLQGN